MRRKPGFPGGITQGMGAFFVFGLAMLYFLPSLVAASRHHHQSGMIFVLNLFLGWTLLGWVIPLAMAAGEVRRLER